MYRPNPLDTSSVILPEELSPLLEKLAEQVHETWAQGRLEDGWVYGEARDDDKRTTPCLVPYEALTEEEKDFDRMTALTTLKTIVALGYRIVASENGEGKASP